MIPTSNLILRTSTDAFDGTTTTAIFELAYPNEGGNSGYTALHCTATSSGTGVVTVSYDYGVTYKNIETVTRSGTAVAGGGTCTLTANDDIYFLSAGVTHVKWTRSAGTGTLYAECFSDLSGYVAARSLQQLTTGIPSKALAGAWAINHNPGANTKATATQASAGTGVKNVCTAFAFKLVGGTTAPAAANVSANLIDGSSGGTAIWSMTMSLQAVAGLDTGIALSDLWLPGTAATAMTAEFSAAAGANTLESVAASGVTQ